MTWVKIDDGFAQHPKVVEAGPLAMAMQVAALGYCNRELTDGFVPRSIARTLIDCDPECGISVDANWVINRLVVCEIWEVVEGGYRIHDYLEYQPSKEEVLALRETRADAGRRGGQQRAENMRQANEAKAKQVAKQNASKVPSKTEAKPKQNSNPVPVTRYPLPVPEPETPSGDIPPKPPVAEKPPIALVVDNAPKPWDAWEAFGEAAEYDIGAATDKERSKALGVAKRMLESGVTVAEIAGCTRYLASQTWRTGILSMSLVESEMGKWRMAKRPEREPPRRGGTGEMTSVGLMRAASDAMRQGR